MTQPGHSASRETPPRLPYRSGRPGHALRRLRHLLAPLCLLTASCSTVHVYDAGGNSEISHHFGVVRIDLPDDRDGTVIRTQGIGVFGHQDGLSIGYTRQTLIGLRPSCHVVFVIEDESQVTAIRSVFGPLEDICIEKLPHDSASGEQQ